MGPHKEMLMIKDYMGEKGKQELGLYMYYNYNNVFKVCEETNQTTNKNFLGVTESKLVPFTTQHAN